MLSCVEHEKSFITLGPGCFTLNVFSISMCLSSNVVFSSHGVMEFGMICNLCLWYCKFIYANFNAIVDIK